MTQFRTKKAARDAGFRTEDQVTYAIPRRDAEPTIVKGARFYAPEQFEELLSRTEAGRRGLSVPLDASPERILTARFGRKTVWYEAFRVSDCKPAPGRAEQRSEPVDESHHSEHENENENGCGCSCQPEL